MFNPLVVRFQRRGKRHYSHYQIVVIHRKSRNRGKAIAVLGFFNPNYKERALSINTHLLAY